MNTATLVYGTKLLGSSVRNRLKRRLGMSFQPILLNFVVTYRCNARCLMCNIWKRYRVEDRQSEEMTIEQISNALSVNRDYLSGLLHVGITGGEPFLRADIVDIIRVIREQLPDCATGPQTNGLMPDTIIAKLKEVKSFYPEVSLAVSLDGIGETHDKIRGTKGAYESALETISQARSIGIERITTGMTLSEINCREISRVHELAKRFELEFSCFMIDNGDYFANSAQDYKLSADGLAEIGQALEVFSHNYYMDNLRRIVRGERQPGFTCYAGRAHYVLDPYGDVKPCILRPEVFGNILTEPLERMLTSKKAEEIRQSLTDCRCWSQCEVSSSVLADALDVLAWLPRCTDKREFFNKLEQVRKSL